ncbi:MAG: O-antigen ligase family protein [bacterium]
MSENKLIIKSFHTLSSKLDYIGIASLVLMLFLVPLVFAKNEFIWMKIFIIYLLLWPIVIAYFLKSMLNYSVDFFYTPVLIPLLLLDIIAGLSIFHAYNFYLAVQVFIKQIAYQAPFFLFIYYGNNIKLKTISLILAIVAIIVSGYGILQFLHVFSSPLDLWDRVNYASTMGLTNFTTDYLVMILPLLITAFFLEQENKYLKYLQYAGVLLSVIYIIIARNRAGWLALLFSLLYYFILVNRYRINLHVNKSSKRLILYTIIIALFVVVYVIGFTRIGTQLVQRGESIFNKNYPSNAFRLLVWNSTINGIKDNPIIGIGLGNYPINIPLYEVHALKTIDWKELRYLDNAHNEYLQITFELGIIGLISFLWFLFEIFIAGIKSINESDDDAHKVWNIALLAGIVSALISAFFTFNLENPASATMFWSFAGLVVGKRKYKYFEDEYGFISALKKMSGFKWRWKYDFALNTANNITFTMFFVIAFIVGIIILGSLTSFAHEQAIANIYNTEAQTLLDLKMPKKALDVINKAYELSPHDYMILYTRARAEAGSSDFTDAIVDAKKVISLAPYFAYGHKLLGFLYYSKDNYAGAINEFNASVDLLPLSISEIGPYLMSSYLSTNDIDRAIALGSSLLKENPQNEVYNFLLGTAYYMKSDYANAVIYLKEAVAKEPSDFKAVLNLTECLEKMNNYKEALIYAVQLTKLEPSNPVSWYTLARINVLLHNESGTFDALERLFKINPSYKMVVVNDGTFSRLLGKPRMKELLTGKMFILQHGKGKKSEHKH